MSIERFCDGCGSAMGACRFPAVIEIGPNAGKGRGMLTTRVELRPIDGVNSNREVDVCIKCIVRGLLAAIQ